MADFPTLDVTHIHRGIVTPGSRFSVAELTTTLQSAMAHLLPFATNHAPSPRRQHFTQITASN